MSKKMSRVRKTETKKDLGNLVVSGSDVQKGDLISKTGPHGEVYRCLFKKSKTVVKFLEKCDSYQKAFVEETETIKKIFHPNVLMIMGVVAEKGTTAIIMESMKCNLYHVLYEPSKAPKAVQKLTQLAKFKILRDIAVGLSFIHSLAKVPHGNLKLTNILFDDAGKVKIGDYFYTKFRSPKKAKGGYFVCSEKGGNAYQAPEIWMNGSAPDMPADVYSFALIILEFLTEKNSFYGDADTSSDPSLFESIKRNVQVTIPDNFKDSLKNILKKCLSYEPKKRPIMENVLGAFDSIVVESTMTSKEAIDFWVEHFTDGDVPLFEVSYDDVMFVLEDTVLAEVDESDKAMIKEELVPLFPENGIVTAVDFDNVECWFGPFFDDYQIIEEMRDVVMAPFFGGLIDKKVAEGKLSGKADGFFLIRMSFTDAKKTPFTLTRNAKGASRHHRIERLSYEFGKPRYQIVIENKKISAQSVGGLVEALIAKGFISTPDDGLEASNYGEA